MYDELVKRMRESKKEQCYIGCFGNCGDCKIDAELEQAADAIEEQQSQIDGWIKQERTALLKSIPKWIPVTERLPCLTTPVLATDGIEVDIAWMYGVPPRWITSFTAIDEDKLTHWMPLPQTPKGK